MQGSKGNSAGAGESAPSKRVKPARAAGKPPAPRRVNDPVTRWLTIGIFAVIVLALATVVSALFFGVVNPSGPPRTEVEQQLLNYSADVDSGKADTQTFAKYADALIQAGQYSKAQSTLDVALKSAKTDKSYLYAEQAELYFATKRYQDTVTTADKAITEANAEITLFKRANKAANRTEDAGLHTPDSYGQAAFVKASALVSLKRPQDAIAAYDEYLKVSPNDSDVLVLRGDLKAQAGDTAGAQKDYRAALTFVPDYQPALDGLAKIGASK